MHRDSGSSLVIFVMGIAVGAVAAALYTPVSGQALRKRLRRRIDEGRDMVEDAYEQADGYVRETAESANRFANRLGDAFQKARDEATSATE